MPILEWLDQFVLAKFSDVAYFGRVQSSVCLSHKKIEQTNKKVANH